MSNEITNSDDVIDSCDVIARIEELQASIGVDLEKVYEERLDALKEEVQTLCGELEEMHNLYLKACHGLSGSKLSYDEWMDSIPPDVLSFEEWSEAAGELNPDSAAGKYIRMCSAIEDWEAPEAPLDVKEAEAEAVREDLEDHDDLDELIALLNLQEEAEGYAPDWQYGATLIHRDYFVAYCEELCKDIGDMPKEIPSYIEIDWGATAKNLEVDYTSVEFDGQEYLIR